MQRVISILSVIAILFGAGYVGKYFYDSFKESPGLKTVRQQESLEDIKTERGIIDGKYASAYNTNEDVIGWISIPDTNIDYPVMQTPQDNEYYLKRDFDKKSSKSGTPFASAGSNLYEPSLNIMTYGHNMKSGAMYHDLLKYADEEFYKTHKYIKFDSIYKGGQGRWEILAVVKTRAKRGDETGFNYGDYSRITTEDNYEKYVENMKKLSLYDTETDAEFGDELLTLSTCAYHVKDGRFVVVAKKVNPYISPLSSIPKYRNGEEEPPIELYSEDTDEGAVKITNDGIVEDVSGME